MYCKYFDDRHDNFLICQVEFEDSSELRVKRDELYSFDEELPKKVKSKMVGTNYEMCNLNDSNLSQHDTCFSLYSSFSLRQPKGSTITSTQPSPRWTTSVHVTSILCIMGVNT